MGVLYNRLLILLNETPADSTFYHIALCMLQDFEQLVRTSIAEVADLCHVSKSTISKFIRAMGMRILPLSAMPLKSKASTTARSIPSRQVEI